MNTTRTMGMALLTASILMIGGFASAQTATEVTATFNSTDPTPSDGAQAEEIGTVTLTAASGTQTIDAVELTLDARGGGEAGDLSSCTLTNGTGVALSTGSNIPELSANAPLTLTFDIPLSISSAVPTTLSLRCDVGEDRTESAEYIFAIAEPDTQPALLGSSNDANQDGHNVSVSLSVAPSVPAGSQNVVLATISLTAASVGSASLSAVPLSVSYSNLSTSNIPSCSIQNALALGTPLSAPVSLPSGATSFLLAAPISISANATQRLALVCSVSPNAHGGDTVTIAIDPAVFSAASGGATSGTVSITPSIAGAVTADSGGSAAPSLGLLPGVPNTGIGGDLLATLLILALSLLAAFIGATVSRRMKSTSNTTTQIS